MGKIFHKKENISQNKWFFVSYFRYNCDMINNKSDSTYIFYNGVVYEVINCRR